MKWIGRFIVRHQYLRLEQEHRELLLQRKELDLDGVNKGCLIDAWNQLAIAINRLNIEIMKALKGGL